MDLNSVFAYSRDVIWANWVSGGVVMIPLFMVTLIIFLFSFQLIAQLKGKKFVTNSEDTWIDWAKNPEKASGFLGAVLGYTRPFRGSSDDVRRRFVEISEMTLGEVDRQARFLSSLVSTAPLLGLLGTVSGMLQTFAGIASGGGNQTVDMVSKGISVALITTQTGLMIALPGLFLTLMIRRRSRGVQDQLTRLEGVLMSRRDEP